MSHASRISVFIVASLAHDAENVASSLQGLKTQLSQQREKLGSLISKCKLLTGLTGPHESTELIELDAEYTEIGTCYAVTYAACRNFVGDLSVNVAALMNDMDDATIDSVVAAAAKMFVQVADGIEVISVQRDCNNEACADEYPPVLPASYCINAFCKLATTHFSMRAVSLRNQTRNQTPAGLTRSPPK